MEWRGGDQQALAKLAPLVYKDLRRLAAAYLRDERSNHTLQPTALVHEAFLRLLGRDRPNVRDRAHFYALAAQLMRRILVDHARTRRRQKRGNGTISIPLQDAIVEAPEPPVDLVTLDDALNRLAVIDDRKSRIIEMRYFGGLTIEETADLLGLSTATVIIETRLARAWLYSAIRKEATSGIQPMERGSGAAGPCV
jgi:RNA polymerase sigma factor (TIGR02999 family)